MEPTMPALHCSITSWGLLMMNSGEPMTGSEGLCNAGGGWTDLLDNNEYEVTTLQFNWLIEGKGLEIKLKGNLKQTPNISYETSLVVALWNQK